jgi:hypothetical protein
VKPSVLMPVYNEAAALAEAVKSVLGSSTPTTRNLSLLASAARTKPQRSYRRREAVRPPASWPGRTGTTRGPLLPAIAVATVCLVAVGVLGTFSMRGFGQVPFSVPSWPWYFSWPSYLFWSPGLDGPAAVVAVPLAPLLGGRCSLTSY